MTANLLIAAISALLCILAAWRDVATRLVPDSLSIAVAVLGLALQIGALGALPAGAPSPRPPWSSWPCSPCACAACSGAPT
jgi:hypothetical protein